MPIALLLGMLLAALDPAGRAAAGAADPAAGDPCDAIASLAVDPACRDVPLCAAGERVRAACELRDAIRSRYVFLASKRALLGDAFDASARLDACVAAERAIEREEEPLRFFDRARRCAAGFEDGHLLVGMPARLPQVALGVGLRAAGGKLVVGWREPGLRRLAGAAAWEALPVGAEVVAIDGRSVAAAVQELAAEIPASSAGARRARAIEALTRRDFAFPDRPVAELAVVAPGGGAPRTVELRWWVSPGAERHPVAGGWARRTGIASSELLAWFEDAARPRPGAAEDGAPPWAPILAAPAASALREWVDENGRVALRFGVVERGGGKDLCYLQILSFHTRTLTGGGKSRPFPEVTDGLVRECGVRRLDLVLDLRRNEGGYLDHSTAVAEALARAGAAQPAAALLLRATEWNESVYRERAGESVAAAPASASPVPPPPPAADVLAPRHILDAIGAARGEGRFLTPAFVAAPLRARPAVGGFDGRVVALTGPACMSACDRLAALLRASGRAVLIGGPTEGAGGSQQETPGLPARWTDSRRLLSVSIPNAAFGVPRAPSDDPAHEVPFEKFFEGYGIENRPVEPDVRYEPRLEDVTANGRGWLEQVDAILFGAEPRNPVAAARGLVPRARYFFAATSAFTFSITANASAT